MTDINPMLMARVLAAADVRLRGEGWDDWLTDHGLTAEDYYQAGRDATAVLADPGTYEGEQPDDEVPVTVDEKGVETHPSFVAIRASRVSGHTTLNDSEIVHGEYVQITVNTTTRRRNLNRDWWHSRDRIIQIDMSLAQWGAFVSSFGDGGGIPVTLSWHGGRIPRAPHETRIEHSLREVRGAGKKALGDIAAAVSALRSAWDAKAGRREVGEKLNYLEHMVANGPDNMAFAAESLTEHAERTITNMRADVEGMLNAHARHLGLSAEDFPTFELTEGSDGR